jgi:hypothetical protein
MKTDDLRQRHGSNPGQMNIPKMLITNTFKLESPDVNGLSERRSSGVLQKIHKIVLNPIK